MTRSTRRRRTILADRRPDARSRRGDAVTGWLMVSPAVVLIGVFGLLPLAWSFLISLQHNDLQTPATWAGTGNYRQLVHDPTFRDSVQHTVTYTALFESRNVGSWTSC